jgi:hypothetical protein
MRLLASSPPSHVLLTYAIKKLMDELAVEDVSSEV